MPCPHEGSRISREGGHDQDHSCSSVGICRSPASGPAGGLGAGLGAVAAAAQGLQVLRVPRVAAVGDGDDVIDFWLALGSTSAATVAVTPQDAGAVIPGVEPALSGPVCGVAVTPQDAGAAIPGVGVLVPRSAAAPLSGHFGR